MSIYDSIYSLIHTYVYGGAALTADMSLVLTLVSTCACLFCIVFPFAVVWWAFKRVLR